MITRIEPDQTSKYVKLKHDDPAYVCKRAVAFTLTPSSEKGWEDVTYYGEALPDPSNGYQKPQWVYVLVNQGIPGICKIGMTTTSVAQRVQEINSATGVITPWYPVHSYKCINAYYLEQEVHSFLGDRGYRINPKREGFIIDSNTAISIIENLGSKYQPLTDNPNLHA